MSDLRPFKTKKDRDAARLLMFAKHYHQQDFLFLTLSFARKEPYPDRKLARLLVHLRKKLAIEYFAVRTTEGFGNVFHLALISGYIHHSEIRKRWKALTAAWNVHISIERNWNSFVAELTGQYGVARYSYSKGFVPTGTTAQLNWLKKNLAFINRFRGYNMYCRLLLRGISPFEARKHVVTCLSRFYGRCSLIYSEKEFSWRHV